MLREIRGAAIARLFLGPGTELPTAKEGKNLPATPATVATASPRHYLLTVLGKNPSKATYLLDGCPKAAKLAPVALFELLPEEKQPDRVLALCTAEAKEDSLPLLREALEAQCRIDCVDIPSGDAQEDIDGFLHMVTQAIPEGPEVELTVDLTHGFRHFSFLVYIAVLYLQALRGTRVRGAYYGMLGGSRDEPKPFLDLRPLLELPDWIYALRTLRDTGSAKPMAQALRAAGQSANGNITGRLERVSDAYLSGLPLELGREARKFNLISTKPLRKTFKGRQLPLCDSLADHLEKTLGRFQDDGQAASNDGWKRRICLTEDELERQARLVDDLIGRGNRSAALGLMNEWTVSWVINSHGNRMDWLEYHSERRKAASLLGAIQAIGEESDLKSRLTEEQQALGAFWKDLSALRNAHHHHGMRPRALIGDGQFESQFNKVRRYWNETLRTIPRIDLTIGEATRERALISPIGARPGVLYSALLACRDEAGEPDICLVICSEETTGRIGEAAERADFGGRIERLAFENPYGGREEIKEMEQAAQRLLIDADQVFVNVTGGTTLMGLAAEALAGAARRLARPVRRFGLIDRRPPPEQDAQPYRQGEPYWLDSTDEDAERHAH